MYQLSVQVQLYKIGFMTLLVFLTFVLDEEYSSVPHQHYPSDCQLLVLKESCVYLVGLIRLLTPNTHAFVGLSDFAFVGLIIKIMGHFQL